MTNRYYIETDIHPLVNMLGHKPTPQDIQNHTVYHVYEAPKGNGMPILIAGDLGKKQAENLLDELNTTPSPDTNPAHTHATKFHQALTNLVVDCGYSTNDVILITDPERIHGILGRRSGITADALVIAEIASLDLVDDTYVLWDGYDFTLPTTPTPDATAEPYNGAIMCFYDERSRQ